MSTESVEKIIGRAVTEPEYRELLFSNPKAALEGYELTEDEIKALEGMDREKFDAAVSNLEDRISRVGPGAFEFDPKEMIFPDKVARQVIDRIGILH